MKDERGLEAANRMWLTETANLKTGVGKHDPGKQQDLERVPALLVALRAATAKDRQQTLYWLERSDAESDPTLVQIKYLKKFDFVRDDKRFRSIVSKLQF